MWSCLLFRSLLLSSFHHIIHLQYGIGSFTYIMSSISQFHLVNLRGFHQWPCKITCQVILVISLNVTHAIMQQPNHLSFKRVWHTDWQAPGYWMLVLQYPLWHRAGFGFGSYSQWIYKQLSLDIVDGKHFEWCISYLLPWPWFENFEWPLQLE